VQYVHNINTSAGIPYPFNETIDSAAYVGFEKLTDNGKQLADYIKVCLSSMYLVFSALQCAESDRVVTVVKWLFYWCFITALNGTGYLMM